MSKPKKFTVVGPPSVLETAPGESVELDPSDPQTVRLLARGHIAAVSSRRNTDGATTEDALASEPEE